LISAGWYEALRLALVPVEARTREEIVRAFDVTKRDGAHALVVLDDAFLTSNAAFISKLALTSHIPGIGEKSHAVTGGLMAYAAD